MDKVKDDPVKALLASNIKRFRSALGLSQEKFAELVGMGHSMLAAIETQEKFPSSKSLYRISQALNVQVFELFIPQEDSESRSLHDIGNLRNQIKEEVSDLIDSRFYDFIVSKEQE